MRALPDQDKMNAHAEGRRRRLLYSMGDLQLTLSACSFLGECDQDATYSKIDLRRFQCFETTLVVAYTRPFSQSRGKLMPLTIRMIGLQLPDEKRALHERLIDMRNRITAHSDSEIMRMTTRPFDVSMGDGGEPPFYFLHAVFDEGITLCGNPLGDVEVLVSEVYHAIVKTLYAEVQADPASFDLRTDSDAARAARNMQLL